MAGNQQQQPALSALGSHLLVRPPGPGAQQALPRAVPESRPPQPRPFDVDLRLHRPAVRPAEEEEDVIDMHPATTVLVPSLAPYRPPPQLSQPLTSLQGQVPDPPTLTLEEMEPRFKSRSPLRLVVTTLSTSTTTPEI